MLRELPEVNGIPIMTRSALESVDCKWRTMSLYHPDVTKRVSDDSDYSRRGEAFHRIQKIYVRSLAAAKTGMDFDLSKEAFTQGIAEVKLIPRLIPEVRDIWDRAVQHFELDLEAYHSNEERILAIDDVPLPYLLEADLIYAHRERDELEVVDAKTYWVAFTEEHAKALLQTRYYIWCAMQSFPGFNTYRFTYAFVRLNTFVSVTFDQADFEVLDREIHALEAQRRAVYELPPSQWEAVPGDVCGFCSLRCPLFTDKEANTGLIRVNDDRSFEATAGALIAFDKRRKAMVDALKRYVTVEGPRTVRGEVFSFRPIVKKLYDAASVVDRVRAKGFQPNFTVSASGLKAMFVMVANLKEDLASIMRTKQEARFGHKAEKTDMATRRPDGEDDDE